MDEMRRVVTPVPTAGGENHLCGFVFAAVLIREGTIVIDTVTLQVAQ
jgi:hypothetical protein